MLFILHFLILLIFKCITSITVPWPNQTITYSVLNESSRLLPDEVMSAVRYAFDQWQEVIPREFVELDSTTSADIRISFERGDHGDSLPFESGEGTVVHSTTNGTMHLNDFAVWKVYNSTDTIHPNQVDFISALIHEIGHVLGLNHAQPSKSIMTPMGLLISRFSNGTFSLPKLPPSEIQRIQEMYGSREP